MKKVRKLHTLWAIFKQDIRGNFVILFALAATIIFASVGLAVEYAQALNQKTRVTNALDAATLATARALKINEITTAEAPDYLEDMFVANLGIDDLVGSRYSLPDVTVDTVNRTVSAEAKYDQNLTFISVANGQDSQDVTSNSGSSYGISDIEVAMVVDITSSMRGSKMTALQDSAKIAVTELLAVNTPTETKVRVSLVPYSNAVNVGSLSKYVFADFKEATTDAPVWDQDLFDTTGVGYSIADYRSTGDLSDMLAEADGTPIDDCATDRKKPASGTATDYQLTGAGPDNGLIPRDSRLPDGYCPDSVLLPLTDNKSALETSIDALWPNSYTGGHIGLQWGYYTISPDWADYMPTGSEPGDHKDPDEEIGKYIILMTDGEFNVAFADSTRYGFAGSYYSDLSSSFAAGMCEEIKDAGIDIFTIGFQLNNADALDMLQNCASDDRGEFIFHHEPRTGNDLKETYRKVAETILSLRLTE